MDITAHTTPESRRELRNYLRNRRLVGSVHQTITFLALHDLEEALQLLQGIRHTSSAWDDEIETFLAPRIETPKPDASSMLPGILDQS